MKGSFGGYKFEVNVGDGVGFQTTHLPEAVDYREASAPDGLSFDPPTISGVTMRRGISPCDMGLWDWVMGTGVPKESPMNKWSIDGNECEISSVMTRVDCVDVTIYVPFHGDVKLEGIWPTVYRNFFTRMVEETYGTG